MPPLTGEDGIQRQNDGSVIGLVTQVEGNIYTQRFVIRQSTVGPSTCCLVTKGMKAEVVSTPTRELFEAVGMPVPDGMIEDELAMNRNFLGAAVAIATLLRHDGMLEVQQVSLSPPTAAFRCASLSCHVAVQHKCHEANADMTCLCPSPLATATLSA